MHNQHKRDIQKTIEYFEVEANRRHEELAEFKAEFCKELRQAIHPFDIESINLYNLYEKIFHELCLLDIDIEDAKRRVGRE